MFRRKENKVLYLYVTSLYFIFLCFTLPYFTLAGNLVHSLQTYFYFSFFYSYLGGQGSSNNTALPLALEGGNLLHPLPWTLAWTGNKCFIYNLLSLLFARTLCFIFLFYVIILTS